MAGYKRKRRRSTPGYRKRTRYMRKKAAPYRARKRAFTKSVKKLIQSSAETKCINTGPQTYLFNLNNSTASSPVDLPATFLFIPQGTNDGERIGEQIRTKKAVLKLSIQAPDAANVPARAAILQLWIGYYKRTPGTAPTPSQLDEIYDQGPVTIPANGSITTLLRKVNTDVFRIHTYKQIKIGSSIAGAFANNDFPAFRKVYIDMTKAFGVVKYDEFNNIPVNKQWYMWMNWVDPEDGVSVGTPSTRPPRVQFFLDYTYTDT